MPKRLIVWNGASKIYEPNQWDADAQVLGFTSSPAEHCSTVSGTVDGSKWCPQLPRSSSVGLPIWQGCA
jgi:hypothetical protein